MDLLGATAWSAVRVIDGLNAALIPGADFFNSSPIFRGRTSIMGMEIIVVIQLSKSFLGFL